jgi:hypothetical protein
MQVYTARSGRSTATATDRLSQACAALDPESREYRARPIIRRIQRAWANDLAAVLGCYRPVVTPRWRPVACYWLANVGRVAGCRIITYSRPYDRWQPGWTLRIATHRYVTGMPAGALASLYRPVTRTRPEPSVDPSDFEVTCTPAELPELLLWTVDRIIASERARSMSPCPVPLCGRWTHSDYLWTAAADAAYRPAEQRRREWESRERAKGVRS